jgi:hypothetical protein
MDDSKNAILIPIIVAALTTMVLQFIGGVWGREAVFGFSYAKLAINLGIGLVAGGAAFGVMKAMGK